MLTSSTVFVGDDDGTIDNLSDFGEEQDICLVGQHEILATIAR